MRPASAVLLALSVFWLGIPGIGAAPTTGKIAKVLPFYLDQQGKHAPSPSLFDRDAYQAQLRRFPEQRSALRFDVQWKARPIPDTSLRLRVEMITSESTKTRPVVLEQPVTASGKGKRWTRLTLEGNAYRLAGELIAWRVLLLDGETLVAEQRSFLW